MYPKQPLDYGRIGRRRRKLNEHKGQGGMLGTVYVKVKMIFPLYIHDVVSCHYTASTHCSFSNSKCIRILL